MLRNQGTIGIRWSLTMEDDDDAAPVNVFNEATHALVWDEAITSDGVSLQSLINKHATVLRHIEIRHGLWWS